MLRNAKTALFKLALLGAATLISTGCGSDSEDGDDCNFGDPIECACPDGSVGAGLCGLDVCDCSGVADVIVPDAGPDIVSDTTPDTTPDVVPDVGVDTMEVDTTPASESICDDGLDDDLDGDIDCDDADCAGNAACVEVICNDGVDNDGDELTDCDDPDCEGRTGCVELMCTDGVDNDGDELTDCEDPDCAREVNCEFPPSWVAYSAQESSSRMALRIQSSDGLGEPYDIIPMEAQIIAGTAFSPDGRYLAYAYNGRSNSGIRILNLETGDEETITAGGSGLYRHPSWHPTDFAILYSAGSEPNTASIYSYDLDTDTLGGPYASSDAVGDQRFFVQGPAWNADASAIYVVAGVPGQIGADETRSDLGILQGAGTDEFSFITTNLGVIGRLSANVDNTAFTYHLSNDGCQVFDGGTQASTPITGLATNIDCAFLADDRFVGADGGAGTGGDIRVVTDQGRSLAQITQTGAVRELNTSGSSLPIDAFTPYFLAPSEGGDE